MNKDANLKPRDVIKRIREDDYEVRNNIERKLSFKDRLIGSLTERVSAELYSETNHFVLELVQNADDNSYLPEIDPSLSIQVSPSQLAVRNNEIGFSENNIRALCSAGQSTKEKKLDS